MFHQDREVSLPTLFPTQISPVDLGHLSTDSFSGPISRSLETRFCGSRRSAIWAIVDHWSLAMGTHPLLTTLFLWEQVLCVRRNH